MGLSRLCEAWYRNRMTPKIELPKNHYRVGFRLQRAADDPDGTVKAVVSELGKVGRDGIIIKKDAVGEQKAVLSEWMHNSTSWNNPTAPVGGGRVFEDDDVLRFEGTIWTDTPEGKNAWRIIDELDWLEWSVTFISEGTKTEYDEETDMFMVVFDKLRVFEASPVPVGGSFGTGTDEIRAAARAAMQSTRSADRDKLGAILQRARDWDLGWGIIGGR